MNDKIVYVRGRHVWHLVTDDAPARTQCGKALGARPERAADAPPGPTCAACLRCYQRLEAGDD